MSKFDTIICAFIINVYAFNFLNSTMRKKAKKNLLYISTNIGLLIVRLIIFDS